MGWTLIPEAVWILSLSSPELQGLDAWLETTWHSRAKIKTIKQVTCICEIISKDPTFVSHESQKERRKRLVQKLFEEMMVEKNSN